MDEYMLKHECGCRVTWQEGMPEATWLQYCPKHKAAPDLAAACEAALEHVTDALLYPDDDELVVALHAALAKARGEATDG